MLHTTTPHSLEMFRQPMHQVLGKGQYIRLVTPQILCLDGDAGEVQVAEEELIRPIQIIVPEGDGLEGPEIGAIDQVEEAKGLLSNEVDKVAFLLGMTGNHYCILDTNVKSQDDNHG